MPLIFGWEKHQMADNKGSNVALGILGGLGLVGLGVLAAKNPEATSSFFKALEGPPPPTAEEQAKEDRRREVRDIEDRLIEASSNSSFLVAYTPAWVRSAQDMLDQARVETDPDKADVLIIRARRLLVAHG